MGTKLTEVRAAVLSRIVSTPGRTASSFTATGRRALAWLAAQDLIEPATHNPASDAMWYATEAGREALREASHGL